MNISKNTDQQLILNSFMLCVNSSIDTWQLCLIRSSSSLDMSQNPYSIEEFVYNYTSIQWYWWYWYSYIPDFFLETKSIIKNQPFFTKFHWRFPRPENSNLRSLSRNFERDFCHQRRVCNEDNNFSSNFSKSFRGRKFRFWR